jgi:phosphoserine phosphatase
MRLVLVILSDPAAPAVPHAVADRVRKAVGAGPVRVLMPDVACEMELSATFGDTRHLERLARAATDGAAVDIAIVPAGARRKKLLLADMDSTMIGQECIDELADMVGLKDHVSAITERAMRGEIAFEPALRERVALLKGLPVSVIDEVIANRITLMPGARTLIATMRANAAHTVLVSGGFSLFTREVAEMIGFDENHANTLLVEDGKLTGTVDEPVLGREAKLDTLLEVARYLALPLAETIAVGDGANDLAMIGRAGLGVAFHAKPAVAAAAHVRIDHGDLTALLYLQGFRRDEFVDK